MKLYDIDKLKRDINQDNLYDLFSPTYKGAKGYQQGTYVVSPEEEMRVDLVSNSVYKSVDYVDFICNLNEIDNPLNIMEGDFLLTAPLESIDIYRANNVDVSEARRSLLNANKSTKIDENRKQYIEQNYALPPTFLDVPTDPVKVENNQIVIGGR